MTRLRAIACAVGEADLAFEELEDFRREVLGGGGVEAAEFGIEGADLAVAGGDDPVEFVFHAAQIADIGIEAADRGGESLELRFGLGAFAAEPAKKFTAEGPGKKETGVEVRRGRESGAER